MVLIQPPSYCQSDQCYTPQQDRQLWNSVVCGGGAIGEASFLVTPGTGMDVNIAPGTAFIEGTEQADEGMYWVSSTAIENRPIAAADPVDPRVDRVVARILPDCTWDLEVLTGTPGPGIPPPPDAPPNSITIGTVFVGANATTVVSLTVPDQAQICETLLPVQSGWIQISEGSLAGVAGATPVASVPGDPLFIRGSLMYSLTEDADIAIRLNGLNSVGDWVSTYTDWMTDGTVRTQRESVTDTSMQIARGYANSNGMLDFLLEADPGTGPSSAQPTVTAKFSNTGTTLGSMSNGLGGGRLNTGTSISGVSSIQMFRTGSANSARWQWVIEAYYPPPV